jgi:hypothetical protein
VAGLGVAGHEQSLGEIKGEYTTPGVQLSVPVHHAESNCREMERVVLSAGLGPAHSGLTPLPETILPIAVSPVSVRHVRLHGRASSVLSVGGV